MGQCLSPLHVVGVHQLDYGSIGLRITVGFCRPGGSRSTSSLQCHCVVILFCVFFMVCFLLFWVPTVFTCFLSAFLLWHAERTVALLLGRRCLLFLLLTIVAVAMGSLRVRHCVTTFVTGVGHLEIWRSWTPGLREAT